MFIGVILCLTGVLVQAASDADDQVFQLDERSPGVTQISYSTNSLVSQITSFDERLIVFITLRSFDFYGIVDGVQIEKLGEFQHGIENAYNEHVYSYCTHGYLAFLKKKTLHIYKLSETRDGASFNQTYPVNYFGIREYSSDVRVNPWNSNMVMKTSTNSIHFFDFRSTYKPTCQQFYLKPHPVQIDFMEIVNYGSSLAVVFGTELDFYSMSTQTLRRSTQIASQILGIAYHFSSNTLVLILSAEYGLTVHCENPSTRKRVKFPLLSESRIGLPKHTGIGILALIHHSMIEFFDLNLTEATRDILYLPPKFKDQGFRFALTFRLSNIVQLSKSPEGSDALELKFLWLRGSKQRFCHPSCRNYCELPFVPCSEKTKIVISMIAAVLLMSVLLILCVLCATWTEKEPPQRLRRGNANLSVIVQSNQAAIERNSLASGISGRSVPMYLRATPHQDPHEEHSLFLIEEEPILSDFLNQTNLDLSQADSEREVMTL